MVRTSEERSLLSNKPAQILKTALILNDFAALHQGPASPEGYARDQSKKGEFLH